MPDLLPSKLDGQSYKGTPRACGRAYGEANAEAIRAFLIMEAAPDKKRLSYAGKCWEMAQGWKKPLAEFVRGMAKGSGLSEEEATLLLLHEEIVHAKPCTALGATGSATLDSKAIIGQNWDWNAPLYPWSRLLRIKASGMPAMLNYSYPGLWASAGINEHGMSLAWTGAGYLPKVKPKTGIPTYLLIAGILTCRNCREAVELVQKTPIAGCFVFFIADADGEVWVLEGGAGKVEAVQCTDVIGRANHYETPQLIKASKQVIPPPGPRVNTTLRAARMNEMLSRYNGRIDNAAVEAMLRDHENGMGFSICQHPVPGRGGMTVDSFYIKPAQRELWIARGHQCRHRYERHVL